MKKQKNGLRERMAENRQSWVLLLRLYKRVKIPWVILVFVVALLFAVKEIESQLVPFTTKIMTGAITESGFLGGFIVMSIVYGLTEAVQGGINELGAELTARNVRKSVWKKLISIPLSSFDKEEKQGLVSRITKDTTGAYAAVASVVQLLAVFYGLYTNFAKMFRIYHNLALIMLTAIPITIIVSYIVGKMQYKIQKIMLDSTSVLTNFFGERLPLLNHIKMSNTSKSEYEKGVEANNEKYKADVKYWKINVVMGPLGTFAQYFNEIILLVVASSLVRAGVMKMPQMVNLYNYFILFMGNAVLITGVWQNIKVSHGSCATIAKICETEDENLESGLEAGDANLDIEFRAVSFAYEEGQDVLKGVTFTIPAGKTTAIAGLNGSGKSTIIRLLERFNEPTSGSITLGCNELRDINLAQWRGSVGHIFQGNQIIKGSIRDNITYGVNRECTDEEIETAAKKAAAYDFIIGKDEGFDTQISGFNSKLSGGEMQRIAMARIFLMNPEYLIMDEATSGIDVVNEAEIIREMQEMMKEKTVIIIAHNMDTIKLADNIVALNNGIVEACGDYAYVKENSPLFQAFESERSIN